MTQLWKRALRLVGLIAVTVVVRGPSDLDQVITYHGRCYGYYHALPASGAWNTCVAVSDDLIHWRKYPRNPLVEGDKSSGIIVDDGRQYRLYTMHPDVRVYFLRGEADKSSSTKGTLGSG